MAVNAHHEIIEVTGEALFDGDEMVGFDIAQDIHLAGRPVDHHVVNHLGFTQTKM